MAPEGFKRKLTAILNADVEGYSRLMRENEEATIRTLTTYRKAMTALIQKYRGRVVDAPGDNLLAEFASVVDAVQCAVEIQREFAERNAELPAENKMTFRIGVNLGDVVEEDGRIYGDGVNIAARLESICEGGGICISGPAFEHIEHKLDLEFEDLGEHEVKNITKPVRVFRVLSYPGAAAHRVVKAKRAIQKKWHKAALVLAVLLVIGVGVLAMWNFLLRPAPHSVEPASMDRMAFPLPDRPSIAVLPFDNMSEDPKQEYFSDGITEEIITALSKIQNLFVIARNSTFTYKGRPVKVQQVAEELGVRYVLEGSVRKARDKVRITAQFVDAITGKHLWAERYDGKLEDIFSVQDEITKKIITELQVKLTAGEQARILARGTDNLDAYLKFLQAHHLGFNFKPENNALARQLAEEAIALDPNWSQAYRSLGMTHVMDVFYRLTKTPAKSLERAYDLGQKTLALDEKSGNGQYLLSVVHSLQHQHEKAIEYGTLAVELNPNNIYAQGNLARLLMNAGRPKESIPLYKKAIRLNPIAPSTHYYNLGYALWMMGRYWEALEAGEESRKRNPDEMFSHILLAGTYSELGRDEDARSSAAEVLRINPNFTLEWMAKMVPWKNKDDVNRLIEDLRKAGIPEHPSLPLPDMPSIAVLPFTNLSDDPEQEFLSDGITEDIITALSKVPEMFVIARNSTFAYKGKPVKVQQVAKELGVRYVLEGSVQKSGDRVRITAQLIDAMKGHHLWAERYDRKIEDIFALQDEITMKLITSLQVKLTEGSIARVMAKGTTNFEAYLKLLQARRHWYRLTKEDNLLSLQMAKEVIALDPTYPSGYLHLAWTHFAAGVFGWSKSRKESFDRTEKLCHKALELDDSLSMPYNLLSRVYDMRMQKDKSIPMSERAVSIDPNSRNMYSLAFNLKNAGRHEESIAWWEKAFRLDPIPPAYSLTGSGNSYFLAKRYADALTQYKRLLDRVKKGEYNPLVVHLNLAQAYLMLGQEKEAQEHVAEVLKLNPKYSIQRYANTSARFYKNQADRDHLINALRKAGLPE
jgi:TolB-like protein/class 3 adenylate cyclase/Tfp pilus assembly protein PilF